MREANVCILSAGDAQSHAHLETNVLAPRESSLRGLRGITGPEDCGPKGQLKGFLVPEALGTVFCKVRRPVMPVV